MELAVIVFAAFFCLNEKSLTTSAKCTAKCEQSRMKHQDTGMKNRAMKGYSFRNVTVSRIYDCHVKCFEEKCRRQAFQMLQNRCELLDEDRFTAPEDFGYKAGYAYFDMNREYVKQVSCSNPCYDENRCCETNPCLHGGTCTELCDDVKHKFSCTCQRGHFGRRCQKNTKKRQKNNNKRKKKQRLGSCNDHFQKNGGNIKSGVLQVFDSQNTSYEVYCDFESEAGKAWTVIESFSLSNKAFFKDKPFYKDFPRNENNFNWNNFRLSNQSTALIRDNSTHWRVTCNFPSGLSFSDYARASLKDTDILTFVNQDKCQMFDYISVRNTSCSNCRGMLVQKDDQHMHTDSYWSGVNKCTWDAQADAVRGEDNFGYYSVINPQHKCTANSLSTTQWWLGSDV